MKLYYLDEPNAMVFQLMEHGLHGEILVIVMPSAMDRKPVIEVVKIMTVVEPVMEATLILKTVMAQVRQFCFKDYLVNIHIVIENPIIILL